jgi:hypothetical protein
VDLDELSDSHTKHRIYERILRILSHFHEYALERIRERKSNSEYSSDDDEEEENGPDGPIEVSENVAQDRTVDRSISFLHPPPELSPQCAHYLQGGRS